ncbi:MAG: hypothetical protein ACRBBN_21045 [Methyloligellaceae bacterium]
MLGPRWNKTQAEVIEYLRRRYGIAISKSSLTRLKQEAEQDVKRKALR